jgi:hypothetical protein
MKKKLLGLILTGGLISTVGFIGCAEKGDQSVAPPDEEKKIVQIGEEVSQKLLATLKGELVKAMKEKGPTEAVKVCSQKALVLTKQVEEEVDHGIKIKRTSFKFRNPANAPDEYEKQALRYFEETYKKKKELPKYYIQKVQEDGKTYYRYYKPLVVAPVCLTCHGDEKSMNKSVLDEIKRIYPNDLARGYKVGDFRGVIRVSIPEEALK